MLDVHCTTINTRVKDSRRSEIFWPKKGTLQYSTPMAARVGILIGSKRGTRYGTVPLWWHGSVCFGQKEVQYSTVHYPYGGTIILAKKRYNAVHLWWHGSVYYFG